MEGKLQKTGEEGLRSVLVSDRVFEDPVPGRLLSGLSLYRVRSTRMAVPLILHFRQNYD